MDRHIRSAERKMDRVRVGIYRIRRGLCPLCGENPIWLVCNDPLGNKDVYEAIQGSKGCACCEECIDMQSKSGNKFAECPCDEMSKVM